MINSKILLASALVLGSAACATAPPKELLDARAAYVHAASTRTQSLAPAQLDTAKKALGEAEEAFKDQPKSDHLKDLAYIATRQSQLAEVRAGIEEATRERARAENRATVATAAAATEVKQELKDTKNALVEAENRATAERARNQTEKAETALAEEKKATARADEKTAVAEQATRDAMDMLSKVASVKEEERGLVISLSGSVLFATGRSILLPGASSRLDQVAEALMQHPKQMITVEGHTDSMGSISLNQDLSIARAQSVMSYLASRGVPSRHMQTRGMGASQPIADNATAEGRANNRRVEIVLSRESAFAEQ